MKYFLLAILAAISFTAHSAQGPIIRNPVTTNTFMNAPSDGWIAIWNNTAKQWSNGLNVSSEAFTNKWNSWQVYGSPTVSNSMFAANRGLGIVTNSTSFSGLVQSIVNRGTEGFDIEILPNPYYSNSYSASSTIIITNWGIIRGSGNPTTMIRATAALNGPIFQIGTTTISAGGINRFKDLRLEGDNAGTNGVGILIVNCAEPVFRDIETTGFKKAGIEFASTNIVNWAYADHCWFVTKHTGAKGVLFSGNVGSAAVDAAQNHFDINDCNFGIGGTGGEAIYVSGNFPNLRVTDSVFKYATGSMDYGISQENGRGAVYRGNKFVNFGGSSPIFFAYTVTPFTAVTNLNPTFQNNSSDGTSPIISIGQFVTNVVMSGNSIRGNGDVVFYENEASNGQINNLDPREFRLGSIATNSIPYIAEFGKVRALTVGSGLTLTAGTLTSSGGGGGGGAGSLPMNANQFNTNGSASIINGALLTNQSIRGATFPTLTASRPLILNASGNATNATGTPDGTRFLRDDGTLAVPADGTNGYATISAGTITASNGVYLGTSQRFQLRHDSGQFYIYDTVGLSASLVVPDDGGKASFATQAGISFTGPINGGFSSMNTNRSGYLEVTNGATIGGNLTVAGLVINTGNPITLLGQGTNVVLVAGTYKSFLAETNGNAIYNLSLAVPVSGQLVSLTVSNRATNAITWTFYTNSVASQMFDLASKTNITAVTVPAGSSVESELTWMGSYWRRTIKGEPLGRLVAGANITITTNTGVNGLDVIVASTGGGGGAGSLPAQTTQFDTNIILNIISGAQLTNVNIRAAEGTSRALMVNTNDLVVTNGQVGIGIDAPTAGYALVVQTTGANAGIYSIGQIATDNDLSVGATRGVFISGRAAIAASSSGVMLLSDSGQTSLNRIQLGGGTAAFPAIGRTNGDVRIFGGNGLFAGGSTNRLLVEGGIGVGTANPAVNGFAIGPSGVSITNILSGSASLDFSSQSLGSKEDLPITVAGAADGDIVTVGPPVASTGPIAGIYTGFASNGVAYVRFTAFGTAQDPAIGTFRVVVTKF